MQRLVSGSPPILLNNLSHPCRYKGYQLLRISAVAHPQSAQLSDLSLSLHHVLGGRVNSKNSYQGGLGHPQLLHDVPLGDHGPSELNEGHLVPTVESK